MPEVAEAPIAVQEAPAEPVVTPEPAPSPVEGEPQEPSERNELREVLKSATPEEIEAFLEAAPQEAREAYEKKLESKGEQRAQTRKKETDDAKSSRLAAWKPYVDNLANAQAYVNAQLAKLRAGDLIDDPKLFETATQHLNVGTLGKVVLENEAYVLDLVDKYLPEMTPEETAKLDKPLYKFGQTGMAKEAVHAIFEVAVERAKTEAFEAGVKKGEGNLVAKEALLEKLTKAQQIKKQSPGLSLNGRPADPSDERSQIVRDIEAVDPRDPEARAKLESLKKRLKVL